MKWLKKHLVWIIVNIFVLLPLIGAFSVFRVDFSGEGKFITVVEQQMPGAPEQNALTPESNAPASQDKSPAAGQPPAGRQHSALSMPIHTTGEWSIRLLTACLTITPLCILFGWRKPIRYRKMLGLYAFGYAALHTLFYIADKNFLSIFDEFNFIIGLIAAVVMLALAVTSNKWSMRKLKRNWKKLQRYAYAAGVLTVLHVLLLGKGWMVYGIIMAVGFIVRIPAVKCFFVKLRATSKTEPVMVN